MPTANRNGRYTDHLTSTDNERGSSHKSKDSCHEGLATMKAIVEEIGEREEEPPSSSRSSTTHAMERLGDLVANLDSERTRFSVSEKVTPVHERADQVNSATCQLSAPSRQTKRNMAFL